jgi:hypothetical protein
VYASRDSATGDVLVLAINQRPDAELSITVTLDEPGQSSAATVYRYSASRPHAIAALDPVALEAGVLSTRLPAESITLLRFPR